MNKSQLRDFAIRSRVSLINSVKLRAYAYGITEEKVKACQVTPSDKALNDRGGLLSNAERLQRDQLLRRITLKGFAQVMEEAAYTWFNRFIALRYMENVQLLPLPQRVFAQAGEACPEILADALYVELDGLDKEQVITLLENNKNELLYKLLLITLTNSLHASLPQMFEKISDYTELLFPDGLLQKDSVLAEMAKLGDSNWQDIQVIGWMYQYYNTELKDETFALLKKNVKITKERIGAATQLFTPEWIVRYMVENSLGRLWLEGHADEALQGGWKYYLPEAEQEPDVAAKLAELRKGAANLRPKEIAVLDPCMGSGHILVAAFDVLMDIYRAAGYLDRDAVRAIVEHNLFGLDIDDRAAQLAYFAVMMTACKYDRRYLKRDNVPQPHVCAIQESNALSAFDNLHGQLSLDKLCVETANDLIRTFYDAKEYGSILDVQIDHLDSAEALMAQLHGVADADFELFGWVNKAEDLLPQLVMQAEIMQRKYDVVVTNPPYMGGSGMGEKLSKYVKDNYPDSKSDLFAVFIEKCGKLVKPHGFQAMITQHAWMFLSSFEMLRGKLRNKRMVSLAHLGIGTFEDLNSKVVQSVAFCLQDDYVPRYLGCYDRLFEKQGLNESNTEKQKWLITGNHRYFAYQDNFEKIPGAPVAYWVSRKLYDAFSLGTLLEEVAHPKKGLATTNNNRFLRLWHEVSRTHMKVGCKNKEESIASGKKWFPLNKGGDYRKWYGNKNYLVNWENNGMEMKAAIIEVYHGGSYTKEIRSENKYFQNSITWSALTTGDASFRSSDYGALFDSAGSSMFPDKNSMYIIALLNSVVASSTLKIINPTMNYGAGSIANMPVLFVMEYSAEVSNIANQNVEYSRADWDSFETSWDFKRHPMLTYARWTPQQIAAEEAQSLDTLQEAYEDWQDVADKRFNQLKANEEALNRIFIDIYGLQDELTPDVAEKDVTVYRIIDQPTDEQRAMRYVLTRKDAMVSFISYAVGCMVGRYSLDVEGLAYAGGDWDAGKYCTFLPDKDGILPISDDEYFEDDIVARFVQFVETVYGANTLEENLRFIADSLGGKGSPREVIRAYFLNDFYKDHLKTYQKRPIYWLFDSGKKNGFKALVYLHRYDRDTLARLRTDYVHPQQERLRTQIEGTQHTAQTGDARQRTVAAKRLDKLQKQLTELVKYEEQLHHLADERIALDLDDGVKVNHAKMGSLVAAIK